MPSSRKARILTLIVSIFLILGFSKAAFAQDIILNDLNGKKVNLSAYKGKPTILFFWTAECPFCRKEIKMLNQVYLQMKKEGISLFAVNVGDSDYVVQRFAMSYAIGFEVLLDRHAYLADKYDVLGVPTFVLIAKSGRVSSGYSLPVDYKKLLFK